MGPANLSPPHPPQVLAAWHSPRGPPSPLLLNREDIQTEGGPLMQPWNFALLPTPSSFHGLEHSGETNPLPV